MACGCVSGKKRKGNSRRGLGGSMEEHGISLPYVLQKIERHLKAAENAARRQNCHDLYAEAEEAFEAYGEAQTHQKGMVWSEGKAYDNRMIMVFQRLNGLRNAIHKCFGKR